MVGRFITGAIILFSFYIIGANWQLLQTLGNLTNITLNNISIDGQTFTLNKGRVYREKEEIFWFVPHHKEKTSLAIRLSGFYMWNKEDPLLTSPDFNVEEFERSTKLLDQQDKRFQEDMSLRYSIFPVTFLYSLSQVKKATDIFLQEPSQETAHDLLRYQYEAVENYQKDIQQRIKLIEDDASGKNKNVNIMFLGVATTPQIVINDYKTLLQNAKDLRSQISKREQCLEGKGQCIRPSKNFPTLRISEFPANNARILSDDILFSNPGDPPLKKGPFSVPTPCLGLTENLKQQKQLYYVVQNTLEEYPMMEDYEVLKAIVATEKFFRRVGETLTKDRITQNMGLSWTTQVTTQTYNCPDLAYLAKLSTMNNYVAKLKKQPLFQNISLTDNASVDKIINRGKEVENQLLTSQMKDFETFEELTNLYLQFYHQVYSDAELTGLQKQADIFLEHGLGMQRLLADIHLQLNRMIADFIALSLHEVLDNIESGNLYLYGIRSIPSMTYLNFSKSIFRSDTKPQYYQNTRVNNVGFDKPYLTYTLALTKYPKEEILTWTHNTEKVLLDVYNTYLDHKKAKKIP